MSAILFLKKYSHSSSHLVSKWLNCAENRLATVESGTAGTTINTATCQVCMPRTVTLLVDTAQLLAAFTETHTISALKRPGEVPCTRGITRVETWLVQEYRDRDPTSFQVHLKLPTNAVRTHAIEVQITYSRSCLSSTKY